MQKTKNYKTIRLGKNNKFLVNAFGISLEPTIRQFCLKVENKEIYNKIGVNNKYSSVYNIYIKPEMVMSPDRDYAYIYYKGDFLDFERAYKKALEIKDLYINKYDKEINIFCFDKRCYFLDKKYLNKDNRLAFKSIEDRILGLKYEYGSKKTAKKGLEKSQALTQKILGIRGN